ncbi:hypothetical protein [Paenibacillus polymyxa]|uniref:hypothetical protein n=1 Tax=Paenibacillus polymyxa TaxID=1406 RepID=UPI002AB51926|nr:hypothetical protein [Paenibacillus polymyxa]MDY8025508.1 hypothetical protein [Paenibacillus polymyxa]
MSQIRTFPINLSELYQASVSSINRNVGENKSYFIMVDEKAEEAEGHHWINLYEPPLLPSLLESGHWDEALAKIKQILSIGDPTKEPSHDQQFTILLYLSSSFALSFRSHEETVEELLGDELLSQVIPLGNIYTVYAWKEPLIFCSIPI